jgi:hypothetical protein
MQSVVGSTGAGLMSRAALFGAILCVLGCAVTSSAQYKGDHIPGFLGLESGTQAPPGIYAGDLLWIYPTSTIKDNNGNKVNQ